MPLRPVFNLTYPIISLYLGHGGERVKKTVVLLLLLICCSTVIGEVSLRVCMADGTPLDINTPNEIMVGTQLAFIVSSNSTQYAQLALVIRGTDANGILSGREPYTELNDWAGSHLPAAGIMANVVDWPTDLYNNPANWFDLTTDNPSLDTGDWFILDYMATKLGTCTVIFINDPYGEGTETPVIFTHVVTRDFKADGQIDFADFAILASYWGQIDCGTANNDCDGKDLYLDGRIDFLDLAYFADYWLEKLHN